MENEFKKLLFILNPNEDTDKYDQDIKMQTNFAKSKIEKAPLTLRKLTDFMRNKKCFVNLTEIAKGKYHKDPSFIKYCENIFSKLYEMYPKIALEIDKEIVYLNKRTSFEYTLYFFTPLI